MLVFQKHSFIFVVGKSHITLKKNKTMNDIIGTNAGKVWTALHEGGCQSAKELKKAVKLTEKDLYAAFGWLAREHKISLVEEDKELYVSLK